MSIRDIKMVRVSAAFALAPLLAGFASAPAAAAEPGSGGPWSGCYAGASVGYARGDADTVDLPYREGPFADGIISWNGDLVPHDRIGSDDSSAVGGIEGGCDYVVALSGVSLVLGAAADFSVLDVSDTGVSGASADTSASFDVGWLGSLRGRVGFASDTVLLYATGGVAWADIDTRVFDFDASVRPGLMDVRGGGTEDGWVAGGGIEYLAGPGWSLSLEYLHFEFDGITATGEAIDPPEAFPRFSTDVEVDVVRAGVKWRM